MACMQITCNFLYLLGGDASIFPLPPGQHARGVPSSYGQEREDEEAASACQQLPPAKRRKKGICCQRFGDLLSEGVYSWFTQ